MRKKKINKKKNEKLIIISSVIVLTLILILISNNNEFKVSSRVEKLNNTIEKEKRKELIYKTIAWIRVQGTDIDYPVIKNIDSKKKYPVELESYLWSNNTDDKFHNNIVYNGHNIFNLSAYPKRESDMFKRAEQLMAFIYYDFAQENEYIQLTIDGKDYIYKIFAVSFINGSDASFLPTFDDLNKSEMKEYIKILKSTSIYNYNIDVNENDKVIALATCNRFFEDESKNMTYVSGRLLRKGEKATRYKVTKNKNYKLIEKVWEETEDEEDEA